MCACCSAPAPTPAPLTQGTTPLENAIYSDATQVVDLLAEHGIVPPALWTYAACGRLDLVRACFDANGRLRPDAASSRPNPACLRLTVHAGELQFTAGSVSCPAADIAAHTVNQSPAGQVIVISVVKDLAVGSRLDLVAGPTGSLPGGEQLQLFQARPPGAWATAGPGQEA